MNTLSKARRLAAVSCACAALFASSTAVARVHAGSDAKLGLGMADAAVHADSLAKSATAATGRLLNLDDQGRALVNVHLDGTQPFAVVRQALVSRGADVVAQDSRYRHGLVSAWIPLSKASALASVAGVRSVMASPRPVMNIGAATSQGVGVLHSDEVNAAGILGHGITVGAMSDSYNKSSLTKTAKKDVASGDLPGAGNPDGYTDPVVVVKDVAVKGTDEGRAMLQIVHDVAPAAKLCFATANATEQAFADNIRALADKAGACKADIIVDDVIYLAEPMFSDGIVAKAVDDVVSQGVSYFSSAGNNDALSGYRSTFAKVDDAAARTLPGGTVNLALITAADSAGGFHDFGGETTDISQTVTVLGSNTLVFQWNDPFDAGAVTADYDIYVFNAAGTKIVASSTDDNFSTDEPVEAVDIKTAGTYQVVIVRRDAGDPATSAAELGYVNFGGTDSGEHLSFDTPTTYGHCAAAGSIGVAALAWYEPTLAEGFTSPGPATIWFDADGNRLATPEVRRRPDVAAPDGGNTTFFPAGAVADTDTDEDDDTLPNFFGTSAAAPHAAAVGALMLEKAGGPGSLTPATVRKTLEATAAAHDLDPAFAKALARNGKTRVTITAVGDSSNASSSNPDAFSIALKAPAGFTLQSVTLDLAGANADRVRLGVPAPGLQFDPRVTGGFPPTLGALTGVAAADVTFSPLAEAAPFDTSLTLTFAAGAFKRGGVVDFGIDRDEVALGAGGNSMDRLEGGVVHAVVRKKDGNTLDLDAPFANRTVKGVAYDEGSGPVDARAAVARTKAP